MRGCRTRADRWPRPSPPFVGRAEELDSGGRHFADDPAAGCFNARPSPSWLRSGISTACHWALSDADRLDQRERATPWLSGQSTSMVRKIWRYFFSSLTSRNSRLCRSMPIVASGSVAATGSNWHQLARNADEFLIPNRTDCLAFLSTGFGRGHRRAPVGGSARADSQGSPLGPQRHWTCPPT